MLVFLLSRTTQNPLDHIIWIDYSLGEAPNRGHSVSPLSQSSLKFWFCGSNSTLKRHVSAWLWKVLKLRGEESSRRTKGKTLEPLVAPSSRVVSTAETAPRHQHAWEQNNNLSTVRRLRRNRESARVEEWAWKSEGKRDENSLRISWQRREAERDICMQGSTLAH